MTDTMGIIVAADDSIPPITDVRTTIALPVAGIFRIIDFVLSNMANAKITNIGVITESNYSSLMEHIKSGSVWGLDRNKDGLNIIPPNLAENDYAKNRGDIDMLSGALYYLEKSTQEYVILSLGNMIYNIDFNKVLDFHFERQSDITLIYKHLNPNSDNLCRYTLISTDSDGRVWDIEKKPKKSMSSDACMDLYVLKRELLIEIIDHCISRGEHDLVKDYISKKLDSLYVFAYEFIDYLGKIDSINSYFENNMAFLDYDTRRDLFNIDNPIVTKNKDIAPTFYSDNSYADNSLIANGCVIEGTVQKE